MRRNTLFWGTILILVGVLLLLQNLGFIPARLNLWGIFWPSVLIVMGGMTLWSVIAPRRQGEAQTVSLPLDNALQARVRVRHGAGRLSLGAGAAATEILSGEFTGGLDYKTRREGDEMRVKLRVPDDGWLWMRGPSDTQDWAVRLNESVPLRLDIKTGASESLLDLSHLRVSELDLSTGASSTTLTLPAQAGHTRVNISAGAASVSIHVPEGVAARIRSSAVVGDSSVDSVRFPRVGDVHQSPDFDTAPHRAEIAVTMGAGSVDIR